MPVRLIGHIDKLDDARRFSDYLYAKGIRNEVDLDDGQNNVWILNDDQLTLAAEELTRFLRAPQANEYREVAGEAEKLRKAEAQSASESHKRTVDLRTTFGRAESLHTPFLSFTVIGICVLVAIFGELGSQPEYLRHLTITQYQTEGNTIKWFPSLPEITEGWQLWRLITPVFIHFGLLHILLNMFWLRQLGGMIEGRYGAPFLGLFILLLAIPCNVGQYLVSGPNFGGMSGVIYGMLGFAWIRGRLDPGCGISVDQPTFIFMMVWFFLCLSGLVGNIANTNHAVGLVLGLLWGYIAAKWPSRR